VAAATWKRRRLRSARFVAITGSAGKTTTKELVAQILSERHRVRRTPGDGNGPAVLAKTILRTTRRDAFCIVEAAAGASAPMRQTARLVQPDIVVVTCIGQDHRKLFRSLDAIAAEKAELLRGSAPDAVAVLNADDPRVVAMARNFPGRIVTFGCARDADLRAVDVAAQWPERLSFRLTSPGGCHFVTTELVGSHWTTCVLAAMAVAYSMGIPIADAARSLSRATPLPRRMSPLAHQGVTYIRDDLKAPLWAIDPVVNFMREARASRKILVLGTLSDYSASSSVVYPALARRALADLDRVVFVGPQARHALRHGNENAGNRLHTYPSEVEARAWLGGFVRPGDLVLIKGSAGADDLATLIPFASVPV
jgi:UDP-N-acetylmuramyl pentapeptide synthase